MVILQNLTDEWMNKVISVNKMYLNIIISSIILDKMVDRSLSTPIAYSKNIFRYLFILVDFFQSKLAYFVFFN